MWRADAPNPYALFKGPMVLIFYEGGGKWGSW